MSLQIQSVTKMFGEQKAVDSLSFSINKGEVVGFLGPNGSGKSTTMKCICGILPPDEGQIQVAGINVSDEPLAIKRIIGYLPEHNPLYLDMYVKEYLYHIDSYYSTSKKREQRVSDIIDLTGLYPEKSKKIGQLSKGYRQRVGLAQALIHNPEVLILDEPTTGLDPNQLVEIRNLISGLTKEKTVLLSTHILQEVEAICDRVLVLNNGKLVADGASDELTNIPQTKGQTVFLEFNDSIDTTLLEKLPQIKKVQQVSKNEYLIEGNNSEDLREILFKFSVENNLTLLTMQNKAETLEEVFRKLTTNN